MLPLMNSFISAATSKYKKKKNVYLQDRKKEPARAHLRRHYDNIIITTNYVPVKTRRSDLVTWKRGHSPSQIGCEGKEAEGKTDRQTH